MRRTLMLLIGVGLLAGVPAMSAYAQSRSDQDDERRQAEQDAAAKKKQKEKEWSVGAAPLPKVKNAGPCPYVKVLYDASRYVELADGKETPSAVGYTGEIQDVRSTCEYKSSDPIRVHMTVDFAMGRGPQAASPTKVYRYWVAVTARNAAVLDKQDFGVGVQFPVGADRVNVSDTVQDIVIPRANAAVSGGNFEVLVGFDVTPQMATFNRLGKRFHVDADGFRQAATDSGASRQK